MKQFHLTAAIMAVIMLSACSDEQSKASNQKSDTSSKVSPEVTKEPILASGSIICTDRRIFLKVANNPNFFSNIEPSMWLPRECEQTQEAYLVGYYQEKSTYQPKIVEFTIKGDPMTYWTYARYIKND